MSKSTLTTFVLIASTLTLGLGCKPKPTDSPDQPVPVQPVETDDGKPVDATKRGEVALDAMATEVTVELGATLTYAFESHGSVGKGADAVVGDPTVLELVRTDMAYNQPGPDRPPGGDAATGTFVVETRGVGTTTLTVRDMFRGDIEREQVITVTVVAP